MAFASTSPSRQSSSDAGNNTLLSRSYFQKSVCLQDWWLIKPETDDDKKTLGVAGVTCTSQENRAERCFTSAPILKVHDFFELETVDGVCVILRGFINKDRTLDSGFVSEVFNHFVIGFPPYWEEFATSCLERGSAAECLSRDNTNLDEKGSIEGHHDIHDDAHRKSRDPDSNNVDMGVQDCEDTALSNETSTACDESSLETPHSHTIKVGLEVLCEESPLTSEFEDNPSLMVSTMSIDVHSMKHDVVRTYPSSKKFKMDAVNSSTTSKCLEFSSRRMTRSMKKTDTSKNLSPQGSLLHDSSSLDNVTLAVQKGVVVQMSRTDPENLGSSDIPRKDKNVALSNNKAVNIVDSDGMNLLHVGASSFFSAAAEVADKYSSSPGDKLDPVELPVNSIDDNVTQRSIFSGLQQRENGELLNSRSYHKGISSSSCGVKCKTKKNISTSEGNPDKQNPVIISSNPSVGYGKGSNEAASCSKDMVLRITSKGKQNDHYAIDVTEYQTNKSSFHVGTSDQRKRDVSGDSWIGTVRRDCGVKVFKAASSDPLEPLSARSMGVGCLAKASTENFSFASSKIDNNDDEFLSRTSMKACRNKKKNIAGKSTSRHDIPDKEDDLKSAAAKQGIASEEASKTRSKSKVKLTSGSSPCEMANRQCMTSPKVDKSTSRLGVGCPKGSTAQKGSKERHESANILSPQSFSGKRSRSGRVLLPTLEFWRNQTVVYDADGQITGIQEGTYVAQSSRDVSEDNKTSKEKDRATCKP